MVYQEKEKIMKFIFRNYVPLKKTAKLQEEEGVYGCNNQLTKEIDRIIALLPRESRRIITAEYINHCDKEWWYQYYSKSTYYRLKNLAVEQFLNCIKE